MGKKSGASNPPVPDPNELAQNDADANRIDQTTPWGSLTYSGENRNQANLEFSPEMQQLFNSQLGIDQSLLDAGGQMLGGLNLNGVDLSQFGGIQQDANLQQFNPSGLQELPQDYQAYRGDVEQAYYDRGANLMRPEFARQEEGLRQTLANQGLPNTGEAFGDQFDQFNTNRNRAYGDLANQSVLAGGQEASRQLSDVMGMRNQGFNEQYQQNAFNNNTNQQGMNNNNNARMQALQEALGVDGAQFNQIASLLGMQQTQQPGLSSFFGPGQVDTLGAQGLSQQQAQANAGQNQASKNAGLGGLFGMGSAAISAFG